MAWNDNVIPSLVNNYGRTASANAKPYSGIIVHVTGKQTLGDELNWMKTNGQGLGYHYIIDRDGKVYQTAPLDKRMNQALPDLDKSYNNNNAIGVAMVAGGTPGDEPPAFSSAQLEAGKTLINGLSSQYNIPTNRVVGHGQIQTDREAGNKLNAGGGYEGQDFINYYNKGAPSSNGTASAPTTAAPGTTINSTGANLDRRTQVFQTLTSLGIKPNVALGAMASLAGESSVNFDPASLGDTSIPGGSVGIGQWNKERRVGLLNYAQSQKASPNDFGTQLGYLKEELSNPNSPTYQPGVLDALRNADSTAQGTQLWTTKFERPKVDNSDQRMQLTSQVGSVDADGNFTAGGGRAPARPGAPTPASAYPPGTPGVPGTTINSTPAGGLAGQMPTLAENLKKTLGLPDDDAQGQGQQDVKPSPMIGPTPQARNVSPLLGAPQVYAQKMAALGQPMTWGSAPPGQMPGTGYGPQAQPTVYGTSLMSNLQRSLDPMWMNSWGQ